MTLQRTVSETTTLLPFLFAEWHEVKKVKVRQWLKFGSVQVNGRSVTQFNHVLKAGDVIEIISQKPVYRQTELPSGLRIVHEDDEIIVLEKPAGWLTIAKDNGKGRNVYAVLTDYVRSANSKLKIWIVHRLDRDTSGLIVFAKTEEAKHTLQGQWGEFEKKYFAIVEGAPPAESGTLRSYLDESNPLRVFSAPQSEDTREAVTHYQVVKRSAALALLELTLETGRRHQIRVQLSDVRCPVVGDERYGAKTDPAERLALHACLLSFQHPVTGEEMHFESKLPTELAKLV
jgi:23S rRNA pseudouridine1911/1915/1917 synthase